MDMGKLYHQEDKNLQDILKMIKKMDLDYIIYLNIHIMLGFGKMENSKDQLKFSLEMKIILEFGKKEKK